MGSKSGHGGLNGGSACRSQRPGWAAHLPPTADQLEVVSAIFAVMQPDEELKVDYFAVKAALRGMGFAVRKYELLQVSFCGPPAFTYFMACTSICLCSCVHTLGNVEIILSLENTKIVLAACIPGPPPS